jgi:hypothetical protein
MRFDSMPNEDVLGIEVLPASVFFWFVGATSGSVHVEVRRPLPDDGFDVVATFIVVVESHLPRDRKDYVTSRLNMATSSHISGRVQYRNVVSRTVTNQAHYACNVIIVASHGRFSMGTSTHASVRDWHRNVVSRASVRRARRHSISVADAPNGLLEILIVTGKHIVDIVGAIVMMAEGLKMKTVYPVTVLVGYLLVGTYVTRGLKRGGLRDLEGAMDVISDAKERSHRVPIYQYGLS